MGSTTGTQVSLAELCVSMPKVELHAHLSGSVSDEILMKLKLNLTSEREIDAKKPTDVHFVGNTCTCTTEQKTSIRSLEECWNKFGEIHEAIKNVEALDWITCQVIGEFSQDRVIYLELRTSPKKIHRIPSKDAYLETVVQAILKCQKDYPIIVKLLISLDRKMDAKDQEENVELAVKWAKKCPSVVVGMDLSGHPKKGSLSWILPLLEKARSRGLRLSCHLSEVGNWEEIKQILEFKPDRVAHGVFIHPSHGGTEELWQLLKTSRLPVEVCITSNVMTGITSSVENHYVRVLHENSLPYTIGTDDSGVFATNLSAEFQKLIQATNLSLEELKDATMNSISYSFATEDEKDKLRQEVRKWWTDTGPVTKDLKNNEEP